MHGATIRISNAQQAKLNNNHKNTKLKLLKTNAVRNDFKCLNVKFYIVHLLVNN